jgi:uncharacterized membrane protein YphA (DoxX/SURF4 family)
VLAFAGEILAAFHVLPDQLCFMRHCGSRSGELHPGKGADMSRESRARKLGYWVTTGIVGAALVAGGTANAMAVPDVVAILDSLGYPIYLARLLGVAKLLAATAILAPGFPRLKEWAYAGVAIDLIGAACSHAASGHGFKEVATPMVLFVIAMASWALRPANRKLPDAG